MFVKHRFNLSDQMEDHLRSLIPPFGYNGYGELIFYRTYSRTKPDGEQETWADCVIRVINGIFSIRKDWYLKNHIEWADDFWQAMAQQMAVSMYYMEWLPPGRGLWAMGSDFVYNRGSMALYNCAFTNITTKEMPEDIAWMMDSLMHGVGVGFDPLRDDKMELYVPKGTFDYVIPDSREGWCEGTRLLVEAYTRPGKKKPRLIYDLVRPAGLPIKGFGGISSGPEPLIRFHQQLEEEFGNFKARKEYDSVYLKTNVGNRTGCCVVAGNVRRSAEIAIGRMSDPVFPDLKNYDKFPEREAFGWMSNNSVALESPEDFQMLGEIAKRVIRNGEPGYINRKNMPFGRIGKWKDKLPKDKATGFNPCGEIPLEHREVCNICETLPTMCKSVERWFKACEFGALYCSTVSLLPTHQPSTNRVVARNRRIGVGIIDYTGWKHEHGVYKVTQWLRDGYRTVRETNKWLNEEAGVPISLRVTTVKPGGTTPKLPGKTSGAGSPTFDFTLRRTRVAKNSPIHPLLAEANIPYEEDYYDPFTDVFEYPILQGPAPPADQVSLWEQAMNLVLLQREWSDNAVSNTLYFRPMWPLIQVIDNDFENQLAPYIGLVTACHLFLNSEKEYIVPERYKINIKRNNENEITEIKVHEYDPKHEEAHIEPVLSAIAPLTKSVSLLPHSAKGAYRQMPEEGISEEEYHSRLADIRPVDWSKLRGSDGIDEQYCQGDLCVLPGR